jgi:epoxyqueuosine reductase
MPASGSTPVERARDIVRRCHELGFALAGVCGLEPSAHEAAYRRWIAAGRHGEMGYLAEQAAPRFDPDLVLTGACSAVMVADLYQTRNAPPDRTPPGHGRVARYARGRDYHEVIKRRLHRLCDELASEHPGARFRAFADTAPVLERELAGRAGLGWMGKHTLNLHPAMGSWMVLGGVLTTLELAPPAEQERHADHCGTCTRCIDACPTGAITTGRVDATRCISYLTIEHRSPIDPSLHGPMRDWVAGCDVCQEVCPHNSPRGVSAGEILSDYTPVRSSFDLIELLGWSAEDRAAAFRGSALRRIRLEMIRRNAVIAAGNALAAREDPALRSALESLRNDASELVRETARAVLAGLGPPGSSPAAR